MRLKNCPFKTTRPILTKNIVQSIIWWKEFYLVQIKDHASFQHDITQKAWKYKITIIEFLFIKISRPIYTKLCTGQIGLRVLKLVRMIILFVWSNCFSKGYIDGIEQTCWYILCICMANVSLVYWKHLFVDSVVNICLCMIWSICTNEA